LPHFRAFASISFLAITIAAALLTMCFRFVSISTITRQAESSNMLIAQAVMGWEHQAIAAVLGTSPTGGTADFPPQTAAALDDLVQDTHARKLRIYDRHGLVIFSTKHGEIGHRDGDHPGILAALAGRSTSDLSYRDTSSTAPTPRAKTTTLSRPICPCGGTTMARSSASLPSTPVSTPWSPTASGRS